MHAHDCCCRECARPLDVSNMHTRAVAEVDFQGARTPLISIKIAGVRFVFQAPLDAEQAANRIFNCLRKQERYFQHQMLTRFGVDAWRVELKLLELEQHDIGYEIRLYSPCLAARFCVSYADILKLTSVLYGDTQVTEIPKDMRSRSEILSPFDTGPSRKPDRHTEIQFTRPERDAIAVHMRSSAGEVEVSLPSSSDVKIDDGTWFIQMNKYLGWFFTLSEKRLQIISHFVDLDFGLTPALYLEFKSLFQNTASKPDGEFRSMRLHLTSPRQ